MRPRYTNTERETTILWDDEQKTAVLYTASPIVMRKLDRLCDEFPGVYDRVWQEIDAEGKVTAARYTLPKKYVKFGKPPSEARKAASRKAIEKRRVF